MKEKEFYKTYTTAKKNFKVFKKMTGTEYYLLNEFLGKTEYCNADKAYSGQTFSVSTAWKKELCAELEISTRAFESAIKTMVDGGIIRRIPEKKGMYQVNPFVFGFGKEDDVDKFRAICLKNEWFRDTDAKSSKLVKTAEAAKVISIESKATQKRVAESNISSISRFMEG